MACVCRELWELGEYVDVKLRTDTVTGWRRLWLETHMRDDQEFGVVTVR